MGSFVKEVVDLRKHYLKEGPVRQIRVKIRKLEMLQNELKPRPSLIKIDIEGLEAEATKGADHLLSSVRPTLIIEIHPLQLKLSGSSEEEVFELLKKHRYGFEVIDRNITNALYSIVAKPLESSL